MIKPGGSGDRSHFLEKREAEPASGGKSLFKHLGPDDESDTRFRPTCRQRIRVCDEPQLLCTTATDPLSCFRGQFSARQTETNHGSLPTAAVIPSVCFNTFILFLIFLLCDENFAAAAHAALNRRDSPKITTMRSDTSI